MGNAPQHTVYTNENGQHIPNWNILVNWLGDLLDEHPTWEAITQDIPTWNILITPASVYTRYSKIKYLVMTCSVSFLLNIPFRKCHIIVVIPVTKLHLFC
jgi:hypothetical protein